MTSVRPASKSVTARGPKERKMIIAHRARTAVRIILLNGEAVAIGLDVGIGAARGVQMLAEQPRHRRHDQLRIGDFAGLFAEIVEKLKTLLALAQSLFCFPRHRHVTRNERDALVVELGGVDLQSERRSADLRNLALHGPSGLAFEGSIH